jgi:hypothetical protein
MHGKLLINELCLKAPDVHCVYGTYLVTGIDSSRLGSTPKLVGVMHVTRLDSTQVDLGGRSPQYGKFGRFPFLDHNSIIVRIICIKNFENLPGLSPQK